MRINVAQQLKSTIGTTRNYEMDELDAIDGQRPVRGNIKMTRTNRGILVEGTLNTEVEATCSRCLSSFVNPLTLIIKEEYFPTTDVVSGASLSVPDEPGCFTIDEAHILDLTDAISQYAVLAVPMKPLCREDCAGLCPRCGQDINQGACKCPHQNIDPRWSKLREHFSISSSALTSHIRGDEKER